MSVRTAYAPKSPQKVQRELEDLQLVLKARNGSTVAMDQLMRRYTSFVRLKASSYFLAGGDSEDLIQEGILDPWVVRAGEAGGKDAALRCQPPNVDSPSW